MSLASNYIDLLFCRRKRKPSATLDMTNSHPFEASLTLKHEIPQLPPTVKIERIYFVPETNTLITIDSKHITLWSISTQKRKSIYSIPSLFLSSQNISFITPANMFLVTTQAENSSIFSLNKGLKMLKSCPIALPFSEYIHEHKLMISYGKDMLVFWNPFNNKVHHQQIESFHNAKYLTGINKIAVFTGLFCEFAILDLGKNLKPGRKKTIYSDDHSFGCLNQIEWIESTRTLVMTDSILGKLVMWKFNPNNLWVKTFELDREGILLQCLKLSDEMLVLTWSLVDKRESYVVYPQNSKMIRMKKDVKKVKNFSSKERKILATEGNSLYLFKY